jgi:hypothetical protein
MDINMEAAEDKQIISKEAGGRCTLRSPQAKPTLKPSTETASPKRMMDIVCI